MKIPQSIGKCVIVMRVNITAKENNLLFEKIDLIRRLEILEDSLLTEKELNDVIKIHQKTTWNIPYRWELIDSDDLYYYLGLAEKISSLPITVEQTIPLTPLKDDIKSNNKKSERFFKEDYYFEEAQLSKILYKSFGKRGDSHKNYPSAGGLYPVIPILLVLNNSSVPFLENTGAYVYNSTEHELLLLKSLTNKELNECKKSIVAPAGRELPNLAMIYAVDIRRSITKYKIRGYRHSLIEVGAMAQNFRNSLWDFDNLRECCYSGFSDNKLTNILGLSPRLAPIIMIQWFGAIDDFYS